MSDDPRYKAGRCGLLSDAGIAGAALAGTRRSPSSIRKALALPYALHCHAQENEGAGRIEVSFQNIGRAGAVFHVHDRLQLERLPRRYMVEAGKGVTDGWPATEPGEYDLLIMGPSGFLREFSGVLGQAEAAPEVKLEYHPRQRVLELRAWNQGQSLAVVELTPDPLRSEGPRSLQLCRDGAVARRSWSVAHSGDWYDFSVRCAARPSWLRRFAGRMETGRHASEPALRRS
jgi:phospholipase C